MGRLTFVWIGLVFLAGIAAGRAWASGPAGAATAVPDSPEAVATATRQAELAELAALQTKVASPPVCIPPSPTPVPSPTATATPVPPVAAGEEMPYPGDWSLTVIGTGISTVTLPDATRQVVQVDFTVTNNGTTPRIFPFIDFLIRDAQGRVFLLSLQASTNIGGTAWYLVIPPSIPSSVSIAFEITPDAGQPFILESTKDPTFRVLLQVQQLG